MRDNDQRLSCYDLENGAKEIEVEQDTNGLGKWSKRVDVSPLTDDKNVFLSLTSQDDLPARFGNSGPATMVLRCMENTTSVIFLFNGHFMSDIQGRGKVEYRIDEQKMASINTSASTDNEALGLWNGGRSIPFIKRLIGSEKIVVRATPHSESSMTSTFDTRGLDEAVSELRETCNW